MDMSTKIFLLVLPVVILVYLFGYYFVIIEILPFDLYLTIVVVSFLTFLLNWYVHRAYHKKDHWLNNYRWFQQKKTAHFTHHKNAKTNFGIAFNFVDEIVGTYS